MKRRDFIKTVAPLATVPLFANRLFAIVPQLSQLDYQLLSQAAISDDRILIIVQMSGGNDGLNTVLPMDQYSNLAAARSNILIPDTSALLLGSFPTGLHPAMTGMKNLYDDEKLTVVQNVSYNSPNFSHFRATDIFTTGSNSNQVLDTGWLGRFIENHYPGFPYAYPSAAEPDPLAISIGSTVAQAFQATLQNASQTIPASFSGSLTQLLPYSNTYTPATPAGTEVQFIRQQQAAANEYSARIIAAWNAGMNAYTYPAPPAGNTSQLAQQMKVVARLIKGGLRTKLYWVKMGSFDTHANQVLANDKTQGTHANLLRELSDSIFAFQEDLRLMNLEDRVMGMTMSEFGRRIKSNTSSGTDHGTSAPVFMFGSYVNPTVLGSNPVIPASVATNQNLGTEFDYRELYMSVLQNWFCLPSGTAETVLGNNQLPLTAVTAPCSPVNLPLDLISFRAEKLNEADAHLTWATASEQNTAYFDIERSKDGLLFRKIDVQNAAGHSHEMIEYDYIDRNLPIQSSSTFYYRLKMVDLDGQFTYSETRAVSYDNSQAALDFIVSPNPSTDGSFTLHFNQEIPEGAEFDIAVTDVYGRLMLSGLFPIEGSSFYCDSLLGTQAGNYYISIRGLYLSKAVKWMVV
jgi:uncharacterized protein (DUF1501 family)